MSEIVITIDQLRRMIGLCLLHQGILCRVIEVLEDGPSLVLQSIEEQPSIQANQHGEANRRTPVSYTVPVLSDTQTELHPQFLAMDLIEG